MANTTKAPGPIQPQPPSQPPDKLPKGGRLRNIFKVLAILLVLVMLGGVGFALGVYLKFVNIDNLANDWKLANYPLIGQYFSKQKTNFEPVDLDQTNTEQQTSAIPSPTPAAPLTPAMPAGKIQPDDKELEKLMKIKQQEEAKRIAKLARLYSAMKPEEAVPIFNQLDDSTVLAILGKMDDEQVSKILALLDERRAANLTQQMLRGRNTN